METELKKKIPNPYEEQHESKTKYTEFVNALC